MPLPLLALGAAGSSLLGGLLGGQGSVDWGALGSQYMNQFGPAYRNQFMQNYGALSPLTMGANNAPGYADAALAAFQRSGAYQGLLGNLGNMANANSQAVQQNASMGQNFGVGQAAYNLGNQGAMFNNQLYNAMLQQYMQGQNQFGQLAGLRLGGAQDMTQGAAGLTRQGMSQYQQSPTMMQRFGQGLQGLGAAGMQYAMMRGMPQQAQQAQSQPATGPGQVPSWSPYPTQPPIFRPLM